MANGVVAQNPSTFADGATPSFRLSKRGELIVPDWWFQVAAEGRIFMFGDGIEDTHDDGQAALADTTPTYILKAPSGGTVLVPMGVEMELTTEGGAAPNIALTYVQEDITVSTAGTTRTVLNALGGLSPRASQAVAQLNPTMAAFTGAQNVVLKATRNIVDNILSVENIVTGAAAGGAIAQNFPLATLNWTPMGPLILRAGSMISLHVYTGTSDSKWRTTWMWAELEADRV